MVPARTQAPLAFPPRCGSTEFAKTQALLAHTQRCGSTDVARTKAPLVPTPNNGLMVPAKIHAPITSFAPKTHAVLHTGCATTTSTIVNATTDTTSLEATAFVIHGAIGKSEC